MNFKIFVGIDQTGAVKSDGQPKSLQVSVIDCTNKKVKYHTGSKIEKLCYESINNLLKNYIKKFSSESVLICIDTVFGLPKECSTSMSEVFKKAKNYTYENKNYGAQVAYNFFNSFIKNSALPLPLRQVEHYVSANSVFKLQPYQKNIGCGSYRIIKELSQEKKWFCLWPFEKLSLQFTICEGYPSYFWKNILGLKTRNLTDLKIQFKNLNFTNADSADSFVLAYGAMKLAKTDYLNTFTQKPELKNEGWIFGVPQ